MLLLFPPPNIPSAHTLATPQLRPPTPPTTHSEGDKGDNFYVVERGTFVATKATGGGGGGGATPTQPTTVATYAHLGAFGELALLHGTPRAATVTAATAGTLWAVARPAFAATLHAASAARRAAVATALDGAALLAGLDPDARASVADCVTPVDVAEGEAVVSQGDLLSSDGGRMYIVAAGTLECVRVLPDGVTKAVTRVASGGWFGEVGLLGGGGGGATRAATVRAVDGPARLLALTRDAFERVAGPAAGLLADRMAEYGVWSGRRRPRRWRRPRAARTRPRPTRTAPTRPWWLKMLLLLLPLWLWCRRRPRGRLRRPPRRSPPPRCPPRRPPAPSRRPLAPPPTHPRRRGLPRGGGGGAPRRGTGAGARERMRGRGLLLMVVCEREEKKNMCDDNKTKTGLGRS